MDPAAMHRMVTFAKALSEINKAANINKSVMLTAEEASALVYGVKLLASKEKAQHDE